MSAVEAASDFIKINVVGKYNVTSDIDELAKETEVECSKIHVPAIMGSIAIYGHLKVVSS